MRRYTIILAACATLLCATAQAREVYNINRDWKFFSNSEVSSDAALVVNIPHTWNADALSGKKDYFRGIGNYLKEIDIPREWSGRRIFIRCYGANTVTDVLLNGKHMGEHRAGYTAFTYEITDHLQFGKKNAFWFIVNNSPQMDVLPIAGDQDAYGGIFRDVELIVTGPEIISPTDYSSDGIYVSQQKVSRERVEAEAAVKVSGLRDNNVTAQLTVTDREGAVVDSRQADVRLSGRATSEVKIPFAIENPRLWNGVIDPYLYNVSVKIVGGDNVVGDSVGVTTGFRTFSVSSEGRFILNGDPYPIKGVVVTQDRATMGPALTTYQVREDVNLIRSMGANAVRVSGVCHTPEFYRLCDRYGLLVWNDLPIIGAAYLTDTPFIETAAFRGNAMMQAREIIHQKFNHPSVVMWGLFSNLTARGDDPSAFITELNTLVKREDPSRYTVAMSSNDGDINFITDLIGWDHFFGWREGMPSDIEVWKKQLLSNWKNLKSAVSYSAGASIFHQEDSLYRPAFLGNWHPERWQTYIHEEYLRYLKNDFSFWGIFVGNMFDYGAASRDWGEGNGINDCGLVTFDRKYCKDAYYLYKANWNTDDPFVYISERRWQGRRDRNQDIRIYSNQPDAELFVNGISLGVQSGQNGLILWPDVLLNDGENLVEVRSGEVSDRTVIEISGNTSGVIY